MSATVQTNVTVTPRLVVSFVVHRGSPAHAGGAVTHFFAPLPQKYVFTGCWRGRARPGVPK